MLILGNRSSIAAAVVDDKRSFLMIRKAYNCIPVFHLFTLLHSGHSIL